MFKRTAYGLANEHLFHGVDLIVYCEGDQEDHQSRSFDEVFWENVLSSTGRKLKVKSVGAKANVLSIAEDIVSGSIRTVFAAMDSDYDPYLGREIFHPQVFYTFGYSWESDLAAALKFESVLGLFANVRDVPAAKLEYEDFLSRSRRRIWQASLIDMKYLDCKGRLFDRHKPQSIIESAKGALPKINAKALLRGCKSLAKTGSRPVAIPACGPKGSLTVFYGKTIIRLIYHWFAWYSERFRSRRLVSFDVFLAYALSNMDTFDKRFPGARHYGLVRDRLSVCH